LIFDFFFAILIFQSTPFLQMSINKFLINYVLPVILAIIALLVLIGAVLIPHFQQSLLSAKHSHLMDFNRIAHSTVTYYHRLSEDGEVNAAKAKKMALENIEQLRFGNHIKDYFWVFDTTGYVLSHPYMESGSIYDNPDESLHGPVTEMIEVIRSHGSGFISYHWQVKEDTAMVGHKTSYISLFEPWGWILGVGMYTADVNFELRKYVKKFILLSLISLVIIYALLALVVYRGVRLFRSYRAEKENAEKGRDEFKYLTENIKHGITMKEGEEVIYINPAMQNILGLQDAGTDISKNAFDYILPDDQQRIDMVYKQLQNNDAPIEELSFSILNNKNQVRHLYNRFYVAKLTDGRIISYMISTDKTDEITRERELRKLSQAITQSPVSIVITDSNGLIEYVNPKFEENTGYKWKEVIGQNPRILKSGKQPDAIFNEMWQNISNGKEWHGELLNKCKDGSLIWESTVIAPIYDEEDEVSHYVAVKENITEKKQMMADLEEAKLRAEESDKIKSIFLANLSHEIRTPLNAIVGFASMLNHSKDAETLDKYVDLINKNSELLLGTIDGILEFSKLEAGKVRLNRKKIDLKDFVTDLQEVYSEIIFKEANNHLRISTEFVHAGSIFLYNDPHRLKQVFDNLITNAVKYTDKGGITLGVTKISNGMVKCYVKDTGSGIATSDYNKVFNRFEHGSSRYFSLHKGTGLGLTITKYLVELMGGEIWFESVENQGTTFYFTISDLPG